LQSYEGIVGVGYQYRGSMMVSAGLILATSKGPSTRSAQNHALRHKQRARGEMAGYAKHGRATPAVPAALIAL